MNLTDQDRLTLARAAREAAERAYAPYSRFRVGSAVLSERGLHTGANIENASYGAALCAERAALASARQAGAQHIRAIALACVDAGEAGLETMMPCGICRQWMSELAPDARVLVCGPRDVHEFGVDELLPRPFRLPRG